MYLKSHRDVGDLCVLILSSYLAISSVSMSPVCGLCVVSRDVAALKPAHLISNAK